MTVASVIRRHSLLKRNPKHSRTFFSSYYERHHGPLAARQNGFRKFTTRYVQNHVLDLPGGSEPRFDGISMTTQVPRADYSQGFFGEPDYDNVKVDEVYLFDMSATVSLLGEEVVLLAGRYSPYKALFLGPRAEFPQAAFPGTVRLIANYLDLRSVSALGFRTTSFPHDLLAEIWFDSAEARNQAFGATPRLLPVREILVFGPEKPWRDAPILA
jgi:hypothetical protein